MKTKKPRRRSLNERFARKAQRKAEQVDELLRLAGEDVPLGSGLQVLGSGPFTYMKMNHRCGSIRVFRFADRATAEQAMQLGQMHDTWPEESGRSDTFGRA